MDHWLNLETWVVADNHWGHGNIRAYGARPDNHYELMRSLWLERVGGRESVLHLGDLLWGGFTEDPPWWVLDLPGTKRLVRGNHDKYSAKWYRAIGFEVIGRGDKAVRRLHLPEHDLVVAFSHEPLVADRDDGGWDVNVHGHVHQNPVRYVTAPRSPADYVNACVEAIGYGPVRLRELLERAGALGKPGETPNKGGS